MGRPIDADALVERTCREHCGCHRSDCCYSKLDDGYDACSRVAEIEAAPTLDVQQRWISVAERLPEDDFEVLVYTDRYGGRHEFAYYVPRLGAWYQNCALLIPNITHWMPLPEPPKED